MARTESSEPESEESEQSSSSGGEDEHENPRDGEEEKKGKGISDYEKQRLIRIAENKARLEALGISKMATSLLGVPSKTLTKRKGKRKIDEEDEDYKPNPKENEDDLDNEDDQEEEEDEFVVKKTSMSRKRKGKNTSLKAKNTLNTSDYVEDDEDLMKAIALSLQDSTGALGTGHKKVKENAEDSGRKKRNKPFTSRVQMTEDELVIYFFQFDEAGKGNINIRDLQKTAYAHDFTWTDQELADMISCFDSDGDGKINLDDFQKIVKRCDMLRGTDNS